ncbi:Cysteine rich repeat [Thiorhodovibrio winogradskyi]|uniref:Cysteine rich repeat n=1 Tax=Thiorhodovibrio winogradskyi TaxID=77007 RepID=A0ABZ0SGP1_9GAMM|nr:cysteine rich repeat-containing protein [Thiorhodovibrio winogradskyi]
MNRSIFATTIFVFFTVLASGALAQGNPLAKTLSKGCKNEVEAHCADVTPGAGRILACLYAYGDKLSGQCELALYDASVQLEQAVDLLTDVAKECDQDLDEYCDSVAAGEARLLICLQKHEEQVSDGCKKALSNAGLKEDQ